MKINRSGAIGMVLLFLSASASASGTENWRTRAFVNIQTPGLIEAIVLPELFDRTNGEALDLILTGPDGEPRAFELYWRELVGETRVLLQPAKVELDAENAFIWEAPVPKKMLARRLVITPNATGTFGKIDVYGLNNDQWASLVTDAAVFAAPGVRQTRIDLPENSYEKLRIIVKGYDRENRRTLSPIQAVALDGDRLGKDYQMRVLPLQFSQSKSDDVQILEAVLPGSGLWIETFQVTTAAQFQGDWQLGYDRISEGEKRFFSIVTGRLDRVDHMGLDMAIAANRSWPERSLVLKLNPGKRYIGEVASLSAKVRLPRLVFVADKAGRYTATAGTGGGNAPILNYPGDPDRAVQEAADFSPPEANPQWRLTSLIEKYQLKGGPFDPQGFTWRAGLTIATPGFYRLILNWQAALAPERSGFRIVKDLMQVPFLTGRPENVTIKPEFRHDYDKTKNTDAWIIRLPQPSPHWKELVLSASGIFKRTVEVQQPKPGGGKRWQPYIRQVWENRDLKETALRINLQALSQNADELHLIIAHGDNQPIEISNITLGYLAPTVYFLGHTSGAYWIYGGNPKDGAPRYDLSMIQSELFSEPAVETQMGEPETVQPASWRHRLHSAFKDTGWGLYGVLGLTTLVLLLVIVRLFPKPSETPPTNCN